MNNRLKPLKGIKNKIRSNEVEGDNKRVKIVDFNESNNTNTSKRDQWLKKSSNINKSTKISDNDEDDKDDKDDEEVDSEYEDVIKLDATINDKNLEEYTFEFYDMKMEYDESITTLLKQTFLNPTSCYNIAKEISTFDLVGTSVICEGGDDVFAFATILPQSVIQKSLELKTVLQVISNLINTNNNVSKETSLIFKECLSTTKVSKTGLFLHKRYPNFPIQLIGSLHSNLLDDVMWIKSQTNIDSEESSEFKDMDYVIIINNASLDKSIQLSNSTCMEATSSTFYDYFEDEVFVQYSEATIIFKHTSVKTLLYASILKVNKLKSCVIDIKRLCNT